MTRYLQTPVLVILVLIYLGQDMVSDLANHPLREGTVKTRYPQEKISWLQGITNYDFSGRVALTHDREFLVYLPYMPLFHGALITAILPAFFIKESIFWKR